MHLVVTSSAFITSNQLCSLKHDPNLRTSLFFMGRNYSRLTGIEVTGRFFGPCVTHMWSLKPRGVLQYDLYARITSSVMVRIWPIVELMWLIRDWAIGFTWRALMDNEIPAVYAINVNFAVSFLLLLNTNEYILEFAFDSKILILFRS